VGAVAFGLLLAQSFQSSRPTGNLVPEEHDEDAASAPVECIENRRDDPLFRAFAMRVDRRR
jgi:hypothetical protein